MEPLTNLEETGTSPTEHIPGTSLLTHWIYELLRPFIRGRILEIATGDAEFTEYLIAGSYKFRISDPDRETCDILKQRLLEHPQIKAVHKIDPYRDDFDTRYKPYLTRFDTLLLVNKANISARSEQVLTNISKLLRPGGHMLICIRTEIGLYNELDAIFEYWKQLSRRSIKKTIGSSFEIIKFQPFNSIHPSKTSPIYFRNSIPEFPMEADLETQPGGLFAIVAAKKRSEQPKS